MSNFDIECFIDNLEIFLKDNLNDAIQAIDDEKNANRAPENQWETEKVDPEAYVYQSLDNLPVNFDPILFYGVSKVETIGIHGATAKKYFIEVTVIKTDDESKTIGRKLLRYQRAMNEIFIKNYFTINNVRPKIEIADLQPIHFSVQNSSAQFKAIGIEIELSIF